MLHRLEHANIKHRKTENLIMASIHSSPAIIMGVGGEFGCISLTGSLFGISWDNNPPLVPVYKALHQY